jgi:hypothetical protein
MPSSSPRRAASFGLAALAAVGVSASASSALAQPQPQAQGFLVERFYPSAPGAGWLVMDDLRMHGGLGAVMGATSGYALNPLRVADGSQHLAVVSDESFVNFGFAVSYDRFRLYLNLNAPLLITGQSGTIGGWAFAAPSVDLESNPDTLTDPRIGFDARLLGEATSPFRLGVSTQLFAPTGNRSDYDSDGTARAMFRLLFAGDAGLLTYAGHLGAHLRRLDDPSIPGGPQGSELLFGVAAGARLPVGCCGQLALVVGPEIYGESALRSLLGKTTTGVEALLGARLEGTGDDGPQLRLKVGTGGGIDPSFGAPEWRVVVGIEMFGEVAQVGGGGSPRR